MGVILVDTTIWASWLIWAQKSVVMHRGRVMERGKWHRMWLGSPPTPKPPSFRRPPRMIPAVRPPPTFSPPLTT